MKLYKTKQVLYCTICDIQTRHGIASKIQYYLVQWTFHLSQLQFEFGIVLGATDLELSAAILSFKPRFTTKIKI